MFFNLIHHIISVKYINRLWLSRYLSKYSYFIYIHWFTRYQVVLSVTHIPSLYVTFLTCIKQTRHCTAANIVSYLLVKSTCDKGCRELNTGGMGRVLVVSKTQRSCSSPSRPPHRVMYSEAFMCAVLKENIA